MFKNKNKDNNDEIKNPFEQDNAKEINSEKVESIESEITATIETEEEKIKQELETAKNQYLRLAADFDNYRKRQAQEREALLKYGAEETIKKILPALDTFERAQNSISEMNDPDKIKESINVVHKQLSDALEKLGLKKIETVGVEFDPNKHEAVMQTPTSEHKDQCIIAELQSGYLLENRIVRVALVNVAVNE